jgi:hypothetical protein
MTASKGKPFVFQHCWKLLEHSEKWNLRDKEAPPPNKGRSNSLSIDFEEDEDDVDEDDNDNDNENDDDELTPARIKARPDGKREGKGNLKTVEAECMSEKIDELMKSKQAIVAQALQAIVELAEKKQQDKMTMWQHITAEEKRKTDLEERRLLLEERRLLLEENKMRLEIIAEESQLMMMDPSGMDEKAREYWEIRRGEILQSRISWPGVMGGRGLASDGGNDGEGNSGVA